MAAVRQAYCAPRLRGGDVLSVFLCAISIGTHPRQRVPLVHQLDETAAIDMRVNLGRRDVGVAEHQLQRPQIGAAFKQVRSEEHTSELQSLMRISSAVFCLNKKKNTTQVAR